MQLKRWITAILAMPLLILFIYKGGPLQFALFLSVVCLVALWEYNLIVFSKLDEYLNEPIVWIGFITGPLIIFSAYIDSFQLVSYIITFNILLSSIISVISYKYNPKILEILAKQIQGIIYIPFLMSYLVYIRNSYEFSNHSGITWIFFVLVVVASNDTGAYYIGTYFGKHKFCPSVSPKKTVEGFIGGVASCLLAGLLFSCFYMPEMSWIVTLLFCVIIGSIAPFGDLFESVLKRVGDIKDSGKILPGHGGILDRIDALLFAGPIIYLLKKIFF